MFLCLALLKKIKKILYIIVTVWCFINKTWLSFVSLVHLSTRFLWSQERQLHQLQVQTHNLITECLHVVNVGNIGTFVILFTLNFLVLIPLL